MVKPSITILLDAEAARAYNSAPIEQKRKIQALVSLWVRELTSEADRSLPEVLDQIGTKAKARGLTPEILDSILKGV